MKQYFSIFGETRSKEAYMDGSKSKGKEGDFAAVFKNIIKEEHYLERLLYTQLKFHKRNGRGSRE